MYPIDLSSLSERDLAHIDFTGLAPIAFDLVVADERRTPRDAVEFLRAADLTIRVVAKQLRTATAEILRIAQEHGIPVVLLKGVAVAEDHYSQPHHRVMGDIDVLVPADSADELQTLLQRSGYLTGEADTGNPSNRDHHHLPGLRHGITGVVVEVHTSLFSKPPMTTQTVFQNDFVWSNTEPDAYLGMPCRKLRIELLLLYTVSHWAGDGKWAVNLLSINDVLLMLRNKERPLNWTLLRTLLTENPLVADYLSVMLICLTKLDLAEIPSEVSSIVKDAAARIGKINMSILHWLILTFPIQGRTKVGWAITQKNATLIWRALLEPRHKSVRLFLAFARVLFDKSPDKSFVESVPGRIRTLVTPNR